MRDPKVFLSDIFLELDKFVNNIDTKLFSDRGGFHDE
jgi:hypothetical protein